MRMPLEPSGDAPDEAEPLVPSRLIQTKDPVMTDRGIQSAREPAERIRRKQISSREMLDFFLAALTE